MAPYYDGLLAFLFRQLFYRIPEVPPLDLHGKAVLLTGANSGIGFSLAMMLASQGAEVITAVRSITKGEAARQQILRALPTANIEVRQCDLASFDSVRSFVRQLKDESKTFDLLILNAGVWCSQWMASADGFDISLQVNVLSNALMAMSLLPCLNYRTGPPRIVFVTSEGHAMVPTPFAQHGRMLDFFNQKAQAFDHYTHYYTSKLFELLLAQAMSRRIDPGKLSIALVSPGLCKSELFRNVRSAPADLLARCFARTCDAGARMIIMASVTQTESPPDTYFSQGGQVPVSTFASSSEGVLCQERLWEEIMSILDSVDPDLESHLHLVS
ncbi:putative short-chain dehydrogenase [Aspergillus fijiensis CBS 313.89]|uniref:Putative short-chain dehydrogenase n=1 Tax=Aspergillus fijiensis CBS 313.89 TaxID=1448319 RepID=A0A8G1VY32_9EURO|nr:putative short-chain dehydrogenase [Aspergillus fijiensis CBS 313.89]RAK75886.1 putative short-chain dehydrogenase [Aspergillus fijiensis CBS 313.89]